VGDQTPLPQEILFHESDTSRPPLDKPVRAGKDGKEIRKRRRSGTCISALTFSCPLCRVPTMSTPEPRLTAQTLKLLGVLMAHPTEDISGSEIARATKLPSGTLYPILLRLERARWLESRWEDGDPHELGRPRRRLYQLTPLGSKKSYLAFREVTSAIGGIAWQPS
jgi:PadR family transcriptional regulator PadR